jgi:hypothetical protein
VLIRIQWNLETCASSLAFARYVYATLHTRGLDNSEEVSECRSLCQRLSKEAKHQASNGHIFQGNLEVRRVPAKFQWSGTASANGGELADEARVY